MTAKEKKVLWVNCSTINTGTLIWTYLFKKQKLTKSIGQSRYLANKLKIALSNSNTLICNMLPISIHFGRTPSSVVNYMMSACFIRYAFKYKWKYAWSIWRGTAHSLTGSWKENKIRIALKPQEERLTILTVPFWGNDKVIHISN